MVHITTLYDQQKKSFERKNFYTLVLVLAASYYGLVTIICTSAIAVVGIRIGFENNRAGLLYE